MNDAALHVFLIADNAADAEVVEAALTQERSMPCRVERAPSLAAALNRLGKVSFDVILLDLGLTDGKGLGSFESVRAAAPNALMLILCSGDDELRTQQVLACGADDHLDKGRLDPYWLPRTL
ncbi:MAG: response regulator, partial [Thauera sp.]|nr:response regulator [Thauera sp.]